MTGQIRYSDVRKQWEFTNDSSLNEWSAICSEDHRHDIDQINNVSKEAKINTLAQRTEKGYLVANAFIAGSGEYKGTYINLGSGNKGVLDIEEITGLTVRGVVSNFKLSKDDGGSSTALLYNASRSSATAKYLSSATGAFREELDADETGAIWSISGAPKGPQNSIIPWEREITLKDHKFTFGEFASPRGSIDVNGNVQFRGTFYGKEFKTQSLRELKTNIVETQKDALDALCNVVIYEYVYKDDEEKQPRIGIIADDVADPYLSGVHHDTFSVSNTVGYLVKAIQQLADKVDQLEKQINK